MWIVCEVLNYDCDGGILFTYWAITGYTFNYQEKLRRHYIYVLGAFYRNNHNLTRSQNQF